MNLLALGTGAIVGIVVGVVVFLAAVILIWWISTHNKFVKLENQAEEGFSTIDVYLKKRYDLIPNLVETVKAYAKHESETFTKVTEARAKAAAATTMEEKAEADRMLTTALRGFSRIEERYPDLKANTNFLDLQNQLRNIENELAQARKYYNATIKVYNVYVQSFPSSIVAKQMKLTKKVFFEVAAEEREAVRVSF